MKFTPEYMRGNEVIYLFILISRVRDFTLEPLSGLVQLYSKNIS